MTLDGSDFVLFFLFFLLLYAISKAAAACSMRVQVSCFRRILYKEGLLRRSGQGGRGTPFTWQKSITDPSNESPSNAAHHAQASSSQDRHMPANAVPRPFTYIPTEIQQTDPVVETGIARDTHASKPTAAVRSSVQMNSPLVLLQHIANYLLN